MCYTKNVVSSFRLTKPLPHCLELGLVKAHVRRLINHFSALARPRALPSQLQPLSNLGPSSLAVVLPDCTWPSSHFKLLSMVRHISSSTRLFLDNPLALSLFDMRRYDLSCCIVIISLVGGFILCYCIRNRLCCMIQDTRSGWKST